MIPPIIQDQFYTIQNLQRSPILQTSNWSGIFLLLLKSSKNQVASSFKIQHEIAIILFRLHTCTRRTLLSIDCLARSTNAYIVRSEQLFLWTVYLKITKLFLTHIEKPVDTHNRKTVQKAWLSHI